METKCISCDRKTSNSVKLPCPKCSKEIFRCDKCRNLSIEYKCKKCGHEGP
ncbi:MAG: zinc finger domain-containing protein [archaeon]